MGPADTAMTSRVLVLDDDPISARAVGSLLAEDPTLVIEVATSTSGARAIAGERAVDAVIASIRGAGSPDDALALVDELRAGDADLVVMVMTSVADSEAETRALAGFGPLHHIARPPDRAQLWPRLSAALERRALRRQVASLEARLQHQGQAAARTAAELETTSSSLETATERLVEAEKLAAVGRVVTGIAHELSQQLALVGYAEAIKSRVAGDAELVELADVIVRAQKSLAGRVDEIRDFADAGAARRGLAREPADLCAVVDEALAIISYDRDVRRRRIARAYRARPLVALDHDRFAQVVVNLVQNAVLASAPGDEVEVAIDRDGSRAVLTVTDHGTGMSPEVLARLGEPFFTTRGDRGSGLGVGICMRIVEEHGGALTFASEVGRGTAARVALPLVEDAA
jgi:signal transduction histidine kinase